MIWIFILVVSIVLNLVLGFTTWNMLRKNEEAEGFIYRLVTAAKIAIDNMREVDIRGSFEADDEVGVTFRALKFVTEDYAELVGLEAENVDGAVADDN